MADTHASGGPEVLEWSQAAIEVESLVAKYGGKRAVDGLSLTVFVMASVAPLYSWTSAILYAGEGLAPLNFLACIALATVLLLVALWLFNRKAY